MCNKDGDIFPSEHYIKRVIVTYEIQKINNSSSLDLTQ